MHDQGEVFAVCPQGDPSGNDEPGPEPRLSWRSLCIDSVVLVDHRLDVVEANDAAEHLVGWSRAELVGTRAPFPFWAPESVGLMLDRTLCGARDPIDVDYVHRSGERRPVRVEIASLGELTLHVAQPRIGGALATEPLRRLVTDCELALRAVVEELGRLDGGLPAAREARSADALAEQLSPREREVLDAFRLGRTVAEMSASMHLSEHTIRSHLKAIYRKAGVRSQAELMRNLYRH